MIENIAYMLLFFTLGCIVTLGMLVCIFYVSSIKRGE